MAARYPSHYSTKSARSGSKTSERSRHPAPNPTPPPDDYVKTFEPCASTASYFLYAQNNVILSLHHDTLTVDRRFDRHKEEVLLIAADNVSERGAGRLVVSYDAAQTAMSWDLFTGEEVARFVSYETIKVAAWMRDGSIAFGNSQGAIILFDVETSEHINTRTMFDPITALAPASDCRTFAIGYQNGSILVATLQPSFTILHTLTTARTPSPINGLAWHGSSSKQKTDMLATQNADGCVRVWSVAKVPYNDPPRVIRNLDSTEIGSSRQNWLAWSKNGRLINFADGEAKAWDVRTKRITNMQVPLVPNVVAISNYGPNGNLFTVSQNHGVQQYDLVADGGPTLIKQVFHVPPNAPPTPPGSTEIDKPPPRVVAVKPPRTFSNASSMPIHIESDTSGVDTSEDEGPVMSPLQRIAQEMDDLEDERRDQLAPLSPVSSRASMSSASSYGRPRRNRHRAQSTRSGGSGGSGGTQFSTGSTEFSGQDSMSIRTGTSMAPSIKSKAPSHARQKTMRSPDESKQSKFMDLFPFTKARLSEVKFRPPRYEDADNTPDVLRCEMLSVVFGWHDDIEDLIRDERARHKAGSASAVLLAKWLGEMGADAMASMVGSESMSSSDWMLLALTGSMGQGTSKQLGEAFVHRLLETDEVHPAVAILLGLGELNEAVEVYVSRTYYLEAVLLACLCFPHDWGRISHLVRKWGEMAVGQGQPELAVRCFSCTSIECSEPWFSPRSQDLTYQAQQQILAPDEPTLSPHSPPSAGSNRLTAKNASLKLITSFGAKGEPKPHMLFGETPIQDTATATTPGARRSGSRGFRDLSATRTATPGGYRSNRMPSASRQADANANPMPSRRATPALSEMSEPDTAVVTAVDMRYGQPISRDASRASSRDRNIHGLSIDTGRTVGSRRGTATSVASGDTNMNSIISRGRHRRTSSSNARLLSKDMDVSNDEADAVSPAMTTADSMKSYKGRSIDRYISSLEQAHSHAQQLRSESKSRGSELDERGARSKSRTRHREPSAARSDFSIGTRGKRSPTSPKSMTVEEARPRRKETPAQVEAEPRSARPRASSKMSTSRVRDESPERLAPLQPRSKPASRNVSRGPSRRSSPDDDLEDDVPPYTHRRRSPTSPTAMELMPASRTRREQSSSRQPTPFDSSDMRARSSSRKPQERFTDVDENTGDEVGDMRHGRTMSRKELAAKELEERRLSLARRPSAPPIPDPSAYDRPNLSPRAITDGHVLSAKSFTTYDGGRSQTVDPDAMLRYHASKQSISSVPMGLPPTPKAMRNPKYDFELKDIPHVPTVPQNATTLAPVSYQPPSQQASDSEGPTLSSSVFQRPPMMRSASAPPEKMAFLGGRISPPKKRSPTDPRFGNDSRTSHRESPRSSRLQKSRGGSRQASGDYTQNSFLDTDEHIVIVPDSNPYDPNPPVLAELAHLNGPPPPPPPPPIFAQLPIHHSPALSTNSLSQYFPQQDAGPQDIGMQPLPLTASNLGRRAGSISNDPNSAVSGSSTSRWARVTDKMRSTSRSRNATKSPGEQQPSPYETLLPSSYSKTGYGGHGGGGSRKDTPAPAVSPYETVYESPDKRQREQERGYGHSQQRSGSGSISGGQSIMRNPKEIRANMPPAQFQWGVEQ